MKPATTYRLQLLGVLAGAAVMLTVGSWYSYTSTFDTATVGLMSVNILQGERPLFFYGQPFFGALEAYLAAFFISLFGFSEFALSLSPISFTLLWIVFTSFLFSRILNRSAGIIAAICVAFPGYYIFWYSIATYGGYSALLCLGTAILWLSLVVFQENPRKLKLTLYCLCIGLLAALAIWVHALTFPYIAIGAALLLLFALRNRLQSDIVFSLGLALLVALIGFIPFYIETGSFFGGLSERAQVSWTTIITAFQNLFGVNIYELVVWNFLPSFESAAVTYLVIYGSLILLILAVLLAISSFVFSEKQFLDKRYYLIPIGFCLLFLALYAQHHLATIKAPRYTMGFWVMVLCIIWTLAITAQQKIILKRTSACLFGIWLIFQVFGTVYFITARIEDVREDKNTLEAIVKAAEENDLKSVVSFGDVMLGYTAQKLSMFAQNETVFSHAGLERYQGNAQLTERDSKRGYLANAQSKTSLQHTLQDLGVSFNVTRIGEYHLFSHLQAEKRPEMQQVTREKIIVSETGEDLRKLFDGNQESAPEEIDYKQKTVVFKTREMRPLCGIWMFPSQNPFLFAGGKPHAFSWRKPGPFEISVSQDGIHYEKVYVSRPASGNGFFAGGHLFIGGPWGKIEALFEPAMARYVKIHFPDTGFSEITEVFIFQAKPESQQSSLDDLEGIEEIIDELDLDFVLADRWLSAELLHKFARTEKEEIALPRHSTRFADKPLRYFITPEKGRAVVCASAVADFCEEMLSGQYGDKVISDRLDLPNYSLFALADIDKREIARKGSALLWNGHVPLQTDDMNIMAPWLHALGMPVWRADYVKTEGIYHDSWTDGAGKFTGLDYVLKPEFDSELVIHTHGWLPETNPDAWKITVFVNGKTELVFKEKILNSYVFLLPDSPVKLKSIEVHSKTFVPGKDTRSLGIDIKRIEIQ